MSYSELEYGYQGLRNTDGTTQFYVGGGDLEVFDPSDSSLELDDIEDNCKQVVVGVCAMAKKITKQTYERNFNKTARI